MLLSQRGCGLVLGVLAIVMVGSAVTWADAATEEAQLLRLEAALERQAQRVADLQSQLIAQEEPAEQRARALREQIRAVLNESEFREQLTSPTLQAGYDRGLFLASADRNFRMKFNARMQFRWTHYSTSSRNNYLMPNQRRHDRAGFDVSRVYFTISGHAYTPDLTYALIIDASEYRAYDAGILHAWVNYRFADEFQVRAGVMRISGTRANINTATMQMVETPIVEEAYTLHRGLGVRLWGRLFSGQAVTGEYRLDIINTLTRPATRTITNDEDLYTAGHDNNPAIIFRTIWSLLGEHCQYPEEAVPYTCASCDLGHHTQPALNVGFHYAYTEDNHEDSLNIPVGYDSRLSDTTFALVGSSGLQIHQFGLDAAFKYRGFSTTAEYVLRLLDVRQASSPPLAPLFQLTGDDSTTAQQAAYVQCGYFLPIPGLERKFEVVGRVGWLHVPTGRSATAWEYAAGLNYYIHGHGLKLQTDVTRITAAPFTFSTNSLANVNDDALIWRVQLQVAF